MSFLGVGVRVARAASRVPALRPLAAPPAPLRLPLRGMRRLATSAHSGAQSGSGSRSGPAPDPGADKSKDKDHGQEDWFAKWPSLGLLPPLLASYYILSGISITVAVADSSSDDTKQLAGQEQPSGQKLIAYEEVQKHRSADDCWVIIDGTVYDVTSFLPLHPGGAQIILSNSGKDATKIFKPLHPPDALETLPPSANLGPVDPLTVPSAAAPSEEEERIAAARREMPPADSFLLVDDFAPWAERVVTDMGWAYYRSAADNEMSYGENRAAWERYYFRPRVLARSVVGCDTSTQMVGVRMGMPVYISPAAMAKLGHPEGEKNLTRGAASCGIVQGISANASCSLTEILEARAPGQQVIFQIYLSKDRQASAELLKRVTREKVAAVMFTVDAAGNSKRTMDTRSKNAFSSLSDTGSAPTLGKVEQGSKAPLGVADSIGGYQDPNLTWDDIDWIRQYTDLPLIVKGVQCLEDVDLCAKKGVQGVIISNHGGRQLDYAPAPIDVLYEIRTYRPDLFSKLDIMVDGGVRSGADVIKAVALGAKAVGVGRGFLFANATHGQEGVERLCKIFHEEIVNTMRNMGVTRIDQLRPEMVGPKGAWVGMNKPVYWEPPRP